MPAAVDVRSVLGKTPADPKLEELYALDKQIGKGAFGVVRLGHVKATGEPVAVKSISKAKLTCKEDVKDVQGEVAIMNLVAGHQNVVMLQVGEHAHDCAAHCGWAESWCRAGFRSVSLLQAHTVQNSAIHLFAATAAAAAGAGQAVCCYMLYYRAGAAAS